MKNKGFTLVELLAVIVILAVISLITVPMILGVIETAKKSAAVESVNGLLDAADKYMITSMFGESTVTRFDFPGDTKLSYKGTKPTNGTFGCPACDSDTSGVTILTTGVAIPTDARYYDLYEANSTTLGDNTWWVYTTGHLGDTIKEIAVSGDKNYDRGLWYSDVAGFPAATSPWVARGGVFLNSSGAGVFSFHRGGGNADDGYASRVVLAF